MRLVHSHDPCPDDDRPLTKEEIQDAINHAHASMWEYVELGEFELAGICARARDRMLDALAQRLAEGAAT